MRRHLGPVPVEKSATRKSSFCLQNKNVTMNRFLVSVLYICIFLVDYSLIRMSAYPPCPLSFSRYSENYFMFARFCLLIVCFPHPKWPPVAITWWRHGLRAQLSKLSHKIRLRWGKLPNWQLRNFAVWCHCACLSVFSCKFDKISYKI